MESKNISQNVGEKNLSPHELASKFQSQIKETVAQKFSLASGELSLLLGDTAGVYISQEEPGTLCCLVVSQQNGHLYLVAAEIEKNGSILSNFRSDVIS